MQQNKKLNIILVGATGLVGSRLLRFSIINEQIERIVLLSRKSSDTTHPKITEHLVDFNTPESYRSLVKGDLVFCCIGTTIKAARSKENFVKVDYTYPLEIAKAAKENLVPAYHLVTALGADANSSIFYNKVKGQVQDAIAALGFDVCCFYQPSMLLGDRTESRPTEKIGQKLMVFFDFLIPSLYKAIDGGFVAQAMIENALHAKTGIQIIPSDQLLKLAKNA